MKKHLFAAISVLALAGAAMAKPTAADLDHLGKDLTLVGAEKAGNKDGTIPAYEGGLTKPPAGWSADKGYVDPFADDKPLFTITGQNADQYKDKLSAGEYAMLKKNSGFAMPVYQTRRTAAYPKEILDKAVAQAGKIELNGYAIQNLGGSTIPFPLPKTGLEAIYNHLVRYWGGKLDRTYDWFPVRASGDYYKVSFREQRVADSNFDEHTDNHQFSFYGSFVAPATLVGTVYLVHEPTDEVKETRQAWIYNAGQRRVRRAPDLAYDNVNDGTEAMRVTDQYDAYNGAPDRFDWKLEGKKEIFVPYNDYKISDKKLKYADIITPSGVKTDVTRYELHRVWVVEATLKGDQKHIFGRRTFYLDEDSWSVNLEDAYDTKGQLWKVGLHNIVEFYDAQVPFYRSNMWYDLTNGNYLLSGLDNEVRTPWSFGGKASWSDFQPDALRRAGTK
jgi:hypothetical protein